MHPSSLFPRLSTPSAVKPDCLNTETVILIAEGILADVKDLPTRTGPFALELRNGAELLALVFYVQLTS